ncbi:MAG: NAD(P)H-dependent oxidoreductase subunit E [Candidatus Aminicenantes bacterium]|nr:NAD(P)H-dependent oxidoreductase subunit E [Candidatus Aminicenantes bacterium]
MNESKLTEIIEKYGSDTNAIVAILQDIQEEFNYLPKDVLMKLSEEINVPLSRILSVSTFYKAFSLTPKGKYPINVCLGTACHVRGGARIMEKIERELGIKRGETSEDLNFSIDEVRCLGCCGLAPVMMIGKDVQGKLSEKTVVPILDQYKK